MSYSALTPCVCGHVANHHGSIGCHVSGCPCRRFDAGSISIAEHNRLMGLANQTIRDLRARLASSHNPEEER